MEFGIFIQGYTPQFRRDVDPDAEHHALVNDVELVQAADRAGFKYVWVTEHHFWMSIRICRRMTWCWGIWRMRRSGFTWGRGSSIRWPR